MILLDAQKLRSRQFLTRSSVITLWFMDCLLVSNSLSIFLSSIIWAVFLGWVETTKQIRLVRSLHYKLGKPHISNAVPTAPCGIVESTVTYAIATPCAGANFLMLATPPSWAVVHRNVAYTAVGVWFFPDPPKTCRNPRGLWPDFWNSRRKWLLFSGAGEMALVWQSWIVTT